MSQRSQNSVGRRQGDAVTTSEARILDAAYTQVMLVGFRRTTLTDVAERAGVARMTVYRRFPDVRSVLQELMLREFAWIVEQARADSKDVAGTRGQIVASAVRGVELIITHELFLRLLDVDPELLLPYVTYRPGRFQDAAGDALTVRLEEGIAEGSVRRDEPRRLARSMQLAMRGFAFAARAESSREERRDALDDLGRMLDGLLRPEGS